LSSDVFELPIAADVQPTLPALVPPQLFDLLLNQSVHPEGFAQTYYSTISHVWGDTININRKAYNVDWKIPASSREKLTQMLEFSRIVGGERYVWLDILCLDQTQSDEVEIARMKSYYTDATACLVWLDKSPNQDQTEWEAVLDAFKSLKELFNLDKHCNPNFTPQQIIENGICNIKLDGRQTLMLAQKVHALEKASWFKRVWTFARGRDARNPCVLHAGEVYDQRCAIL
jgi:Heterokaryon incompatibility protein (HET)